MSFDAHANLAYSVVTVAPSPALSGTSLTVLDSSQFPAAPFNVTIWPDGEQPLVTNAELARVTNIVGNVLTITRTAEAGGMNRAIIIGDQIAETITAKSLQDIEAAIPSTAGLISAINVSAGLTSNNLSRLTFDNSNGVSFGLTGSVVTATVATNYQSAGAYLTTAALSQDSSKYAGTNGAITGGSITVNTSGVSVNLPAYLTTALGSNASTNFVQANATFFGTNASGTIASNAISVSAGAGAQTNQTVGLYASSNTYLTSSGTVDARSLTFRGDKSITVGISNGEVAFSVGAYLTTAMQSNAVTLSNIRVSAGTTSNLLSALTFADGSGVSWGINASTITATVKTDYLTTAMASNRGSDFVAATAGFNGTNASGTIASNSISVSVATPIPIATAVNDVASANSTGTITRYAPEDHRHAGIGAVGISTSGGTAGTTKSVQGTYWFQGGNNITVSQITSNNGSHTLVISGPNAGGAQTGISSIIVSDATYTSGMVSFSNQNNITIGSSVNGGTQYIRLSVGNYITTAMASNRGTDFVQATAAFNGTNASGTIASDNISVSVATPIPIATNVNQVASANSTGTVTRYAPEDHRHAGIGGVGISTSGNTAGTTKSVQGTYWFEGGNSITVSQITSNNGSHTLVISAGAYLTTAMASNRASDFVQATAVFNGTNATGTIASGAISVSVAAPIPLATTVLSVASANSVGTVTRYAAEDHRHAGVGGIGISTSGNTAGTTGSVLGTYWLQGGNSITVSQITSNNGSHTLVISAGAYLTTAMASNRASDFVQATAVFNGTNATGTIASGAISVSVAAPIPLATTVLSVASANSVGTVTRYAAEDHRHAGVGGIGISTSGNTAGTTGSVLGTYWFQGGNSITVSQITSNNGSHTLVISAGAYLTTAMASNRGTDFVQATAGFNGTNASGTIASNSISVSVAAPIPIATTVNPVASANSTGTVTRYAPEDHKHAGIGGIGISTSGNTAGTTGSVVGTYWFQGGANLTVSQITSNNGSHTLILSAGTAAAAPVNFSAGTTSNNLGSVTFSDSNGISFGLNGSTITASANTVGTATTYYDVASANSVGTVSRWAAEDHRHAGIGALGISTGNTLGTSGSKQGTYWVEGSGGVSISQITSNNGSHTLRVVGQPAMDYFDNAGLDATVLSNPGQMTLMVFPFTPANDVFPGNMSVNTVFLNVTQSVSTAATWTNQLSIAFYSSVNSTQLTRVVSGSSSWGTNAGNMNINDSFGGTRWLTIHSSNFNAQPVFSAGINYWCAIWHRTSNNAGSMSLNLFGYNTLNLSAARSGVMGLVSVNNSTRGWGRFNGIYSVTFSSAMPDALAASDINKSVAQVLFMPHVILNNAGSDIV